jgi:hypothetical protein
VENSNNVSWFLFMLIFINLNKRNRRCSMLKLISMRVLPIIYNRVVSYNVSLKPSRIVTCMETTRATTTYFVSQQSHWSITTTAAPDIVQMCYTMIHWQQHISLFQRCSVMYNNRQTVQPIKSNDLFYYLGSTFTGEIMANCTATAKRTPEKNATT